MTKTTEMTQKLRLLLNQLCACFCSVSHATYFTEHKLALRCRDWKINGSIIQDVLALHESSLRQSTKWVKNFLGKK